MNIDSGNLFLRHLKQLYFHSWRPGLLVLILVAVAYLLYFRRLGVLLPGYSAPELQSYVGAADWHSLSTDPINALYLAPVWFFGTVIHHSLLITRVVAACFGILAVMAFFAIARQWYSFRVASLGTLLFATSAGFLHFARLGTPQILQMSILALLLCILWYKRSPTHRTLIGYMFVVVCALLWYIPGMIWFEVLGAVFAWPILLRQLRHAHKIHLANWAILFLVLLAPLIRAVAANTHLLVTIAGLPGTMDALSHVATNFYHAVLTIGVRSNGDPFMSVGHVPLLNAAELVLGAVGAYTYIYRERSVRAVLLTGAIAITLILISFGTGVGTASLVPLLYLFIVHGLDHLLGMWFTVFPRNPIARTVGITVACSLLFFSIFYQVRVYFVAWPHSTATEHAFNLSKSEVNLLQ